MQSRIALNVPESELCFQPAHRLRALLLDREVSARELVEAYLSRIDRINPTVNAIVTRCDERAREAARQADEALARGEPLGLLHGLPVVIKDLHETKGIRTTYGSPVFRNYVPTFDALIVERLFQSGAIPLGKSNTPEFGAGSQTFNPVFGATANPYDLSKTCGGSSGGSAVGLACGMTALADGSDTGGSLRNPASFCNVVGLRPSPGRVPVWPTEAAWFTLPVQGPMGRTVQDVALMLAAIAGPDPRSPIAIEEPGSRFLESLERDWQGVRVGWSPTLGGLPVDPRVTEVLESALPTFADLGITIVDDEPDWRDVDEIFTTLRAWFFELQFSALIRNHPGEVKETIVGNAAQGESVTGPQLARVEQKRTRLFHRMRRYFDRVQFLLAPVVQVPPFDKNLPYIDEIAGQRLSSYIDWMKSCYYISATGLPALSVPCGFTRDGLPIGIQIVGRHHDDFGVLQLGYAFEQATGFWKRQPTICQESA